MKLQQINVSVLNHLLNQQPWSKDQLCRFAGKSLSLAIPPVTLELTIESNGEFGTREEHANLDATLSLPPAAAVQFALSGKLDISQISITGDTELAQEVGKILRNLSWDIEDDLSRVIGDIPAHKLTSFSRKLFAEGQRQLESLAGMFAEFWQEEDPIIAKRQHLEQFAKDVDALRDDTERLAKRIEKLG